MKIFTFPKRLSEREAYEIAKKRGNIIGRMMVKKDTITMKLMYLESREIIFNMTYEDAPLVRLMRRNAAPRPTQKIRMLVEGTRGLPAYVDKDLELQEIEVTDESAVQNSELPDEKLVQEGKFLARRMVRRQLGKTVTMEVDQMRSVYRPYYIAFYGAMEQGTKVRYLPIPADKNIITRTC
ncbi:MAG: hypothetical protein ACK5L0_04420 [Candidatus Fimivivens sp.]